MSRGAPGVSGEGRMRMDAELNDGQTRSCSDVKFNRQMLSLGGKWRVAMESLFGVVGIKPAEECLPCTRLKRWPPPGLPPCALCRVRNGGPNTSTLLTGARRVYLCFELLCFS